MSLIEAVERDDLEQSAISIAQDDRPGLAKERVEGELDALAERLRDRLGSAQGVNRALILLRGLHRELGFRAPSDYGDPRLHYLDRVLERRQGSPVLLAIVLVLLGRRAGVPLSPVAFPGHFLVRWEGREPLFADPCTGAMPIPRESLLELATSDVGASARDAERLLEPAPARTVALRILQNLQRAHAERGDHGRALVVADRVCVLTGSPSARFERALHALALGAHEAAREDLQAYLLACPQASDAEAVRRATRWLDTNRKLAS